jgi:hypothetical protein
MGSVPVMTTGVLAGVVPAMVVVGSMLGIAAALVLLLKS